MKKSELYKLPKDILIKLICDIRQDTIDGLLRGELLDNFSVIQLDKLDYSIGDYRDQIDHICETKWDEKRIKINEKLTGLTHFDKICGDYYCISVMSAKMNELLYISKRGEKYIVESIRTKVYTGDYDENLIEETFGWSREDWKIIIETLDQIWEDRHNTSLCDIKTK